MLSPPNPDELHRSDTPSRTPGVLGARQWFALYRNYIFCYLIFYQTCRRIIKYAFNTFNTALEGPKHLVNIKEKLKINVIGLAHFFSLFVVKSNDFGACIHPSTKRSLISLLLSISTNTSSCNWKHSQLRVKCRPGAGMVGYYGVIPTLELRRVLPR